MSKKEIINPQKDAIFSPAVRYGNLVYTTGVIGRDASGKLAPNIHSQSEAVLETLKSVLEEAGTSMDNVLKVLAFVVDLNDRTAFNQVYKKYFKKDPPARSCVAVSDLGEGVLLEVECVACIPE